MDDEDLLAAMQAAAEEATAEGKKPTDVEKLQKDLKIWKIIGISAGAAFVGALIWALVK